MGLIQNAKTRSHVLQKQMSEWPKSIYDYPSIWMLRGKESNDKL